MAKNTPKTNTLPASTKDNLDPLKFGLNPSDRLTHLMREADKRLVRAFQNRLSKHRIAHGHWTFLRILWENDGISQVELSERAGVMNSSTSVAIQAMAKLGYVVRKQHADNAKKVYVYLTKSGRALEAKLVPLAIEVNDLAAAGLKKSEIEQFRMTLIRIIKNLDAS